MAQQSPLRPVNVLPRPLRRHHYRQPDPSHRHVPTDYRVRPLHPRHLVQRTNHTPRAIFLRPAGTLLRTINPPLPVMNTNPPTPVPRLWDNIDAYQDINFLIDPADHQHVSLGSLPRTAIIHNTTTTQNQLRMAAILQRDGYTVYTEVPLLVDKT
jgi:hypothetical protein